MTDPDAEIRSAFLKFAAWSAIVVASLAGLNLCLMFGGR